MKKSEKKENTNGGKMGDKLILTKREKKIRDQVILMQRKHDMGVREAMARIIGIEEDEVLKENLNEISDLSDEIPSKKNGTQIMSPEKESKKLERIPWNGSKKQLKCLFKALKENYLLEGDKGFPEFEIHFDIKGNKTPLQKTEIDKIRWVGTIRQIVYLNSLLINKGLFNEEKKYKLLADNFKKKDGSNFNPIQLANAYSQFNSNPEGRSYKQIEEIVEII